jgi:hypothetical protein
MIKMLMIKIREFITWGVTILSYKLWVTGQGHRVF